MDHDLVLENLLLAALLIVGGARLKDVSPTPDGRRVRVRLVRPPEVSQVSAGAREFADSIDALPPGAADRDWVRLFDTGWMGRVDWEYRRLKTLAVEARS